jgi:hypothetical protein
LNATRSAGAGHERLAAVLGLLLVLALVDPPAQLVASRVDADRLGLVPAHLDAAETRVVERLGRHEDERGGIAARRQRDLPLGPELHQVVPPRLLQPREEQIGAAEQEHLGHRRIALGERGQVLVDDGLEEARDDLLDGHAGLHQGIGVRLGEDPALAAHLVEALAVVRHVRQPPARHLQLARRLLHEGARAAAACRLHEDLLGLGHVRPRRSRARGGEEDGLHVLAADLGDEAHVGVQLLHARRDGDDLLDQLAAGERRQEPRARAGEEDAIMPGDDTALALHPLEELEHLLGLAGIVPLVVLPGDAAVLHDHRLHGGGADVHPDQLHQARPPPASGPGRDVQHEVGRDTRDTGGGTRYVAPFISGWASRWARSGVPQAVVRAAVDPLHGAPRAELEPRGPSRCRSSPRSAAGPGAAGSPSTRDARRIDLRALGLEPAVDIVVGVALDGL